MIDYSELRAAAQTVPSGDWQRTSPTDPHWMRAISIGDSHSAIWSGMSSTRDAYSIMAFVATANPTTILGLLDELDALRAQIKPAKPARNGYPAAFEAAWSAYPPRAGANKRTALKAWTVRIKGGVHAIDIMEGVERYAAYVLAERTEERFIKQPATFFGPDEHYTLPWTSQKGGSNGSIGQQDYSAGVGDDGSF